MLFRMRCKSAVICRASISMKPDPNIPSVFREFAIPCSGASLKFSAIDPRVTIVSATSKVAKSNR